MIISSKNVDSPPTMANDPNAMFLLNGTIRENGHYDEGSVVSKIKSKVFHW